MNTDRFWLFDPEGDGFQTFATESARDAAAAAAEAAAAEAVKQYLASDGWAEEVELLSVGVITGRARPVDIKRPVGKINDECVDEDGVYWGDMIGAGCKGSELEMCNYAIIPLPVDDDDV